MKRNRLKITMESRIHGDVYVRFGGERLETYRPKGRQGALRLACGTYHPTWLEKIIADYYPAFVKPAVAKALKEYQFNAYYKVEEECIYEGVQIYSNSLLGERVYFSAKVGSYTKIKSDINTIKELIDDNNKENNNESEYASLQRVAV